MSRKSPHPPKHHGAPAAVLPKRWLELCASAPALCLMAVGLALALYWRTLEYEFIDLDDTFYVLTNPQVLGGLSWASVRWALVDLHSTFTYWHPLTWLSLMLDATLYGQWAGGYHATSFLLHALNVALVFRLMHTITADKWSAFAVAAIFAVHPVHLESVVWITERKDVLFMFWGLLALNSYLAWARGRSRPALVALYCCYALSLMSKPVLVVLPGLLLLLDYWPLGRFSPYDLFRPAGPGPSFSARLRGLWPLLREKLPVLALALCSVLITVNSHPKTFDLVVLDSAARYGNAFLALSKYVWKLLMPTDLAILYPFPVPLPTWPLVLSIVAFCTVSLLVLWKAKRHPWLLLGLGWFLLGFLPTIVTPKVGMHLAMADRAAYFPYVGGYLVIVLGAREIAARLIADRQKLNRILALCLVALLGWYWSQATFAIAFWRNKYTIYERAIEVTPGHHILYNNYGKILLDRQDFTAAETYVLKALALQPGFNLALGNLGNVYMGTGRFEQAIAMFQRALAADPDNVNNGNYHFDMARCLARLARYDEAEKHYLQALAVEPNDPEAHNDLGHIALLRGDLRRAGEHFAQAVALDPDYRAAKENLAQVQRTLAGGRQ
ncbi:MAG: hypothetical protein A2051_02335 [Desulfovibrionales bacterium GWA2_65_9]|nr:MAG: hypothetical protein A2051_02335 [Desulfovibrionales bacterium GWA2_65_9]